MNDTALTGTIDIQAIEVAGTAVVSEEDLLYRARRGDKSAFGTLYLRHRDAARRVATMCVSTPSDADDAVAEGFARVFAAMPRMDGRAIEFRPYLLTCVRNAATDRIRRERRVDLRDTLPDAPGVVEADDGAMAGLERNLVGEALQALPSRWRTVLWLMEVEGLSPLEVADRIGIKPNAVSALAYRARKGLREAYLQAHLRTEAASDCRATVSRLGHYVRAELPERERAAVVEHLDGCVKCRGRRDELTDVNATLRHAFLPVPLLLAGMQRRWFHFFSGNESQVLSRLPEAGQVTAVIDSPLTHKVLAGITMAVLALSGATVPESPPAGEGVTEQAAPFVQVVGVSEEPSAPVTLDFSVLDEPLAVDAPTVGPGSASRGGTGPGGGPSSAPSTSASQSESEPGQRGGLFSRLVGAPEDESGGGGGHTRQGLIPNPDDGSGRPGLLTGTVGPVVKGAAGAVEAVVPVAGVAPVLTEPMRTLDKAAAETVNPLVDTLDSTVATPVDLTAPVLPLLQALGAVQRALGPLSGATPAGGGSPALR